MKNTKTTLRGIWLILFASLMGADSTWARDSGNFGTAVNKAEILAARANDTLQLDRQAAQNTDSGSTPSPIDLHSHSYCSDGIKTPETMVQEAKAVGLRYYALSDHDTAACLARAAAAAKASGLAFIPSMEISSEDDTVHILAVDINPDTPDFKKFYAAQNQARIDRLEAILNKLAAAGAPLDIKTDVLLPKWNRELNADNKPQATAADAAVMSMEGLIAAIRGQITRPDVARALIARGYVKDNHEAFDKYLGENDNAAAYVPMIGPSFRDAIAWIHAAGGIAVLAHPYTIFEFKFRESSSRKASATYSGKTYVSFDEFVQDLVAAGIDGFETYIPNPKYGPLNQARVEGIIAQYKAKAGRELLETPGSDYHGGKEAGIGPAVLDGMSMPPAMAQKLLQALQLAP